MTDFLILSHYYRFSLRQRFSIFRFHAFFRHYFSYAIFSLSFSPLAFLRHGQPPPFYVFSAAFIFRLSAACQPLSDTLIRYRCEPADSWPMLFC